MPVFDNNQHRQSNRFPSSFIYRPQTKAWTVRTRCETCWRCFSKPDTPDLLQSSRRCPAITRLEACSRSTSHYMDPSDPPGHGNTGDWCSLAGRGQIVLATNHNGGMLRLIAPRHDDDDDDDDSNNLKVKTLLKFILTCGLSGRSGWAHLNTISVSSSYNSAVTMNTTKIFSWTAGKNIHTTTSNAMYHS